MVGRLFQHIRFWRLIVVMVQAAFVAAPLAHSQPAGGEFAAFPWLVRVGSDYSDELRSGGQVGCSVIGRGFIVRQGEELFVVTAAHLAQGGLGYMLDAFDADKGEFVSLPVKRRLALNTLDFEVFHLNRERLAEMGYTPTPLADVIEREGWQTGLKNSHGSTYALLVAPEAQISTDPERLFDDPKWYGLAMHSYTPALGGESPPSPLSVEQTSWAALEQLRDKLKEPEETFARTGRLSNDLHASRNLLSRLVDGFHLGKRYLHVLAPITPGMSGSPLIWLNPRDDAWYVAGISTRSSRFVNDSYFANTRLIGTMLRGFADTIRLRGVIDDTRWHCRSGRLYRTLDAPSIGLSSTEVALDNPSSGSAMSFQVDGGLRYNNVIGIEMPDGENVPKLLRGPARTRWVFANQDVINDLSWQAKSDGAKAHDLTAAWRPITLDENLAARFWRHLKKLGPPISRSGDFDVAIGFDELFSPVSEMTAATAQLHFKPTVDETGRVTGLEFRLRFRHRHMLTWRLGQHLGLLDADGKEAPFSPIIKVKDRDDKIFSIEVYRIFFRETDSYVVVSPSHDRDFYAGRSNDFWVSGDGRQHFLHVTY